MTEQVERLRVLLLKYSTKTSSIAEEKELYTLLNNSAEEEVEPLLTNILENTGPSYDQARRERILASIFQNERSGESLVVTMEPRTQLWKKIAVAASVIGIIFLAYFITTREKVVNGPSSVVASTDVPAPDKNRAQIKLSDGTVVYLDSAANGQLATQSNVTVTKTEDGKIIYTPSEVATPTAVEYNTLMNPRGSKVQPLTLSDGTKVWLNAESSITYPTAFASKERKVSITGEAYFEVAHNVSKPFFVSKGDVSVQVLGTHFNVNAYDDESEIKVTLLEGSVKVTGNQSSLIIKPNQQAIVKTGNAVALNSSVDVAEVMAWKNGMFKFTGSDIETVMKQVARWYDVDIAYESTKPIANFRGTISRQENITEVLKMLELTKAVKFRIENKKIIVTK